MELRFCPVCAGTLATRVDEQDPQKLRLSCPDGHWTHWDNPLPVLAALVEVDGKILLARNAAWPEKNFALITGFMERGETPEQGVARELKEETNLDADIISLIGVYEFIKKNEVIIAYHVRASGDINLSPELVEYRLIEPQKLRPWNAGTGHAVADWMRSNGYDPVYAEWPSG
ncbi:NUDIX domain-containing protein [Undibacterium jejuense]|uniref:NUDIX domain-containing protein n=1 Tax=Undibacterium jejuense TaxID=1344949 RepID=A0A923HIS6_9BURK|nr:NUDIX domain-containing protein [Undibacterium jejuense]MBC3862940.1 NUDIX domain-containing protein [Undibacterium jejuense]